MLPFAYEYIPGTRSQRVMPFHYALTLERVTIFPLDS